MTGTRADVVREALTWVGTPYVAHQQVKGAGCDCATILVGVYGNAGVIEPFNLVDRVGRYPVEWHLHQDQERYLNGIFEWVRQVNEARLGTISLFRVGRTVAHSGIVVGTEPTRLVHAWHFGGTNQVEVATWNQFFAKHFHGWFDPKVWAE